MARSPEIVVLDELLQQTTTKVRELQEQQEQIQRDLEVQNRLLVMLQANRAEKVRKSRQVRLRSSGDSSSGEANGSDISLADHIARVLGEAGTAMQGAEVTKALTSRGITTGSKHGLLPMVLATLRSRKGRFRKVARGRYALRKTEPKEAVAPQKEKSE